jgi:hypothetical protein
MSRVKDFVARLARGARLRGRYRTPKAHSHLCRYCGYLLRCEEQVCRDRPSIDREHGCERCDWNAIREAVAQYPKRWATAPVWWLMDECAMSAPRVYRAMTYGLSPRAGSRE